MTQKRATEEKLRELEHAHAQQSRLVARLREENKTVKRCRQTMTEQEKVVEKLELLLEKSLLDKQQLQRRVIKIRTKVMVSHTSTSSGARLSECAAMLAVGRPGEQRARHGG